MPHQTRWEGEGFIAEFSGEVLAWEIEAVNNEFTGNSRFDEVRYSLWDMSRITRLDMTGADVDDAAATDKGASMIKHVLRGAIVVPEGQVRDLVDRYLLVSGELENSWDTRLFGDVEAARRWLTP